MLSMSTTRTLCLSVSHQTFKKNKNYRCVSNQVLLLSQSWSSCLWMPCQELKNISSEVYEIMCLSDSAACVCEMSIWCGSTLFSRVVLRFLVVMSQENIIGVLYYLSGAPVCKTRGGSHLVFASHLHPFLWLSVAGRGSLYRDPLPFDSVSLERLNYSLFFGLDMKHVQSSWNMPKVAETCPK